MKAITLLQPWAMAVVLNLKPIETRSWETRYRGPLAIHASRRFPVWCRDLIATNRSMREGFVRRGYTDLQLFTLGAVIGRCSLVDCMPVETFKLLDPMLFHTQQNFGDFSPGRFAWILGNILKFTNPVPAKGMLGLWEWEETE